MTLIVYLIEKDKAVENRVWKVSAILSWPYCPEKNTPVFKLISYQPSGW